MKPETPWRHSPPSGPEGEALQKMLEDARQVEPWSTSERALGWWRIADAASAPKRGNKLLFAFAGAGALALAGTLAFVVIGRAGPAPLVEASHPGAVATTAQAPWAAERLVASNAVLKVADGARYQVAGKTVRLDAGRVEADARGEQLTFVTPSGSLVVSGTRFLVAVENGATSVQAFEGDTVVRGDGAEAVTLHSGERIRSDDARLHPAPAAADGRDARADRVAVKLPALHIQAPKPTTRCDAESSADARAACLSKAAGGSGLAAQTALFALGLTDSERGRDARADWQQYQTRFPDGLFAPEVSLSLMSAHADRGDRGAAVDEADRFLRRFPNDARAQDVAAWRTALVDSMKLSNGTRQDAP